MRALAVRRITWVAVLLGAARAVAAEPPPDQARVHLQLEPVSVALARKRPSVSSAPQATALQQVGYDWLGANGSEIVLSPGRQTLALTQDAANVISPTELDVPAGRSTLHGRIEEHSRALPLLLIGTSPVVWYGSLLFFKGVVNDGDKVTGGQVAIGTGLALTELVTGIVLLTRPKRSATFTLVPAALAPQRSRFGIERAVTPSQAQGLSLQLTL